MNTWRACEATEICRILSAPTVGAYICEYVKNKKPYKLQNAQERQGVLYTRDQGPLGVLFHHLKCDNCRTMYSPNFYVPKDSQTRFYYLNMPVPGFLKDQDHAFLKEMPDILHMGGHRFIETRLIREWRYDMSVSHKSGSNCCKVYHKMHLSRTHFPEGWTIDAKMRTENVYDAFKALSLLEFYNAHGSQQLQVPHGGLQAYRFVRAMEAVNRYVRKHGLAEVNHRCNKCVRKMDYDPTTGTSKEIFAVVCDGVTLGRPCCCEPG
ncbi:hypothetical protein MPER_07874, partial [Moniliophthora perniciosa FA553]